MSMYMHMHMHCMDMDMRVHVTCACTEAHLLTPSHTVSNLLIPSHTFSYLLIPSHTFSHLLIPSHTFSHLLTPTCPTTQRQAAGDRLRGIRAIKFRTAGRGGAGSNLAGGDTILHELTRLLYRIPFHPPDARDVAFVPARQHVLQRVAAFVEERLHFVERHQRRRDGAVGVGNLSCHRQ